MNILKTAEQKIDFFQNHIISNSEEISLSIEFDYSQLISEEHEIIKEANRKKLVNIKFISDFFDSAMIENSSCLYVEKNNYKHFLLTYELFANLHIDFSFEIPLPEILVPNRLRFSNFLK